MSSRFFLLLFFPFTFSLGFSQNTIKNGTFKGNTKKTKLFKKSDSKLLNKKGEFTIQSRYNRRVKKSLIDFNGQYRMQHIYLSSGLTFMFPQNFDNSNDYKRRGRMGVLFEAGAYYIFENGGNIFNYLDYGLGFKRLAGSQFINVREKSIFKQNYLSGNVNLNNIWQLSDKKFLQSSIGANMDLRVSQFEEPKPLNTDQLIFSFHLKVGYGIKISKTLFVIPTVETPLINVKKWEDGKSTYGIFDSRYRPFLFKLRFIWLKNLGKGDCPPVPTNPDDEINKRNYMQ